MDESLGKNDDLVENKQVSGRLRIYPPGVGVSRIAITLSFKKAVHVEAAAQIARDIEQLEFIDPDEGDGKRCETLLEEAIDEVVRFLFGENYLKQERRWRPPETVYSILGYECQELESNIPALAYLLWASVGNEEQEFSIESRLIKASQSKHWNTDRILAVASQRASLFLIGSSYAVGRRKKQQQLREWLIETSELVWAACYAGQGFADKISALARLRRLNDEWLPEKGEYFQSLEALLQSMRNVFRAVETMRSNVKALGEGMLTVLARDTWRSNNAVKADMVVADLEYLIKWLRSSEDSRMKNLLKCAEDLVELSNLFRLPTWGKTRV
ncbi:MAG TPA: hypothetical protein VJW20_24900 [Candidatus Angelobacter sp.]|nr:hypothetical protein [Candidatus Angelobacter sp.]